MKYLAFEALYPLSMLPGCLQWFKTSNSLETSKFCFDAKTSEKLEDFAGLTCVLQQWSSKSSTETCGLFMELKGEMLYKNGKVIPQRWKKTKNKSILIPADFSRLACKVSF